MTKKCICFSRVSSLRQDLEAQKVIIKKEALKEYKESEIIEVEGKESAIKKDEMERQTLNEMKSIVDSNPTIESIYFFAVDRLARRVSIVMSIKEWADSRKINLVFLNPYPFSTWFKSTDDGVWKKNDISDVYLMFLAFGAKMEMEIKGERFKAAKRLLKSKNQPTGRLLFGYCKDSNNDVQIDSINGDIIKWLFDCYLKKDMSTTKIYEEGVEKGYWGELQSRSSKSNRIRQYLSNYAYAGEETGRDLVYPAIVTKEEVEAAITKLSEAQNKPKSKSKHLYLCKGILKDSETGYTLKADIAHIRYMSMVNDVKQFTISMNVCDTCIWKTAYSTKWILLSRNDDNQVLLTKRQLNEVTNRIVTLRIYINDELNPKYEKAYTGYVNSKGRITEKMYNNTIDNINKELDAVKKRIEKLVLREMELKGVLNELENKEKRDIDLKSVMGISDDNQRRAIIEECVTNMTVKKIKKELFVINIYHLLPDSPTTYIYAPRGGYKHLYFVNGIISNYENINFAEEVLEGNLIDQTDDIMKRFKMTYSKKK